ncbi:UvrD-helicase domain-containing protein [Streptacidiphilus albus]|uniref:UvrD-helicase domain-containing protein n=1 Tax=Streptacidiphilus albus TaxID=105425 RepID=UPI00054C7ABB|nr:UvrD-helicase domain-containing protein [Streptacidiphilus albus]
MTADDLDDHVLTPAQQSVVDQPWSARTLVTAGAGSGKTHTLVRRLDALVEREELEAAEILVLSFSRAAVRELRERIDRHATAAQRVRAQTFDSWAGSLLAQAYPDGDWSGTTFDERIVEATRAIGLGAVEAGEHGAPAHVLIDEVQDLVGVRREMVEELLDRFSEQSGFTVVGDAAQAVYGFQVADPDERAQENNYFFDWIRGSFGEDLVEVHLADNFRARTPQARVALAFGEQLQKLPGEADAAAAEAESIHRELRRHLLDAPFFGDLSDSFPQESLKYFDGTTAILCRDNGQALRIGEILDEARIHYRLQRSVRDRPAPAWIARLLAATESSSLTEERFTQLVTDLDPRPEQDPALLWRSVRKVARGPRATVNIQALHRAVAESRLPDELTAPAPASLVVSTVHRAKGLEFDRVLIVEPALLVEPKRVAKKKYDYDPAAETRLLYVAMTRPRDDIYYLKALNTWLLRKDRRLDRWYVGGRSSWARNGIEALGSDVSHEHPPGVRGFPGDPRRIQVELATTVVEGDPVELRLLHRLPEGPEQSPPYAVVHDGQPIAEVSEGFRRDLQRMLIRGDNWADESWPGRITGLRVECVESVAGTPAATERAGLGSHGCWLAPRLSGLGRFEWWPATDTSNDDPSADTSSGTGTQ